MIDAKLRSSDACVKFESIVDIIYDIAISINNVGNDIGSS